MKKGGKKKVAAGGKKPNAAALPAKTEKDSPHSRKKKSTESHAQPADAIQLQESKPERVSFSAILDRLKAANSRGEAVSLSSGEVCEVYIKLQSLEICASELPITVFNNRRQVPFEILEFTEGPRARGSEAAEISRQKKWLEVFNLRAWQYLQQIFKLLHGPSGVESDAADHILRMMQGLEGRLEEIAKATAPQLQAGATSAAAAHAAITKAFRAKIETQRKTIQRAKNYATRKKKRHTSEFSSRCELLVFEALCRHFDWLEDSESPRIQFSSLDASKMPEMEFGTDSSSRPEWERWIYSFLENEIFRKKTEGDELASLWLSHRSHLKSKVIPSYWHKAGSWRAHWESQQVDSV